MARIAAARLARIARDAGRTRMYQQDKVWSRYSNDKVDIAATLGTVIRTLCHALPLHVPLHALSVGSSNEPQFRILASLFQGGLHLLDIEEAALDVVAERVARQQTPHVSLLRGDFTKLLADETSARRFRTRRLGGRRMALVTFHHSLYYAPRAAWRGLLAGAYRQLLAPARQGRASGAIHAVLMASRSDDPRSTTWLYQNFAGRFFGVDNDQDLAAFARTLRREPLGDEQQLFAKSSLVDFWVDDFERFMSVVWMILLYPNVHRYTLEQRIEITEHVYTKLWSRRRPLLQVQDHVVLYRGRVPRGATTLDGQAARRPA